MKKRTLSIIMLVASIAVTACAPKSAVERIEKNLGDFRYIGLAPRVKVRVLKQEVVKPDSEYGRAKFKVTGVIQQEGDFPVKRYWTTVVFAVKMDDKEVGSGRVNSKIESGTAAFTEEFYLGELSAGVEVRSDALRLELTDFGWSPHVDYKDQAILEIAK